MISSLELAKLCGVSQGTVDRALHNRKGISEDTRKKILNTASEYGYIPNPAAREIITGRNMTVSAILPNINSIFMMDLMSAIKSKISQSGHRLIITTFDNVDEMFSILSDFSARKNCASIIVPPEENMHIPEHISTDMKIISLLNPAKGKNVFFISPDERETGRKATEYLIAAGHEKILHLTYARRNFHAVKMRVAGYEDEMKKKGLKSLVISEVDEKSLIGIIKREKPTALFCHNDWLALTAIRILEKNKIAVPANISVLGIDNSHTFTDLCADITTMEYPFAWAASAINSILEGKQKPPSPPAFKIIERKTLRFLK